MSLTHEERQAVSVLRDNNLDEQADALEEKINERNSRTKVYEVEFDVNRRIQGTIRVKADTEDQAYNSVSGLDLEDLVTSERIYGDDTMEITSFYDPFWEIDISSCDEVEGEE